MNFFFQSYGDSSLRLVLLFERDIRQSGKSENLIDNENNYHYNENESCSHFMLPEKGMLP